MREVGNHRTHDVIIRPIRKSDVAALVGLHVQFEEYLRRLDPRRKPESTEAYRVRLIRDGFGQDRAFRGFLALTRGKPVGYVFYHEGYDPDEMQGRVLHVIDLYVTETERRKGIGSKLMKAVAERCRRAGGIDIYFAVWERNKQAHDFYRGLGASHNPELLFFHWKRTRWRKR